MKTWDQPQPGHLPSPVWSESSLSTWGKPRPLAIIRVHSEASDQTGQTWVFAGRKGQFVGFVMRWLILLCLTCINNPDFCYFEVFYFLKLTEKARVFMYPCMCLLVSVYYVILQTSSNTHLYLSRRLTRHCSYSLSVGPREDIRVVSLMVNGYADIYKDNRQKHLRTHRQCQIEGVSSPWGLNYFAYLCCRPNWHCPQQLTNRRLRLSKVRAITVNVTMRIVFFVDWHDSYTWLSTVCPANTCKDFMSMQVESSLDLLVIL